MLTRDRSRAAHLSGTGVEIVEGDVRDPESVGRALQALAVAFLLGLMTVRRGKAPEEEMMSYPPARARLYRTIIGAASAMVVIAVVIFTAARHFAA